MIRGKHCQAPPSNWGPGIHIIPIPIFHVGAFGTSDVTLTGGVPLPPDVDVYGWYYGVGDITGGSSPTVDFAIQFRKANIQPVSFVASVQQTGVVTNTNDYVDLSSIPTRSTRTSTAVFCTGRAIVHVGGVALTALSGLALGLIVKPIDGATAFNV